MNPKYLTSEKIRSLLGEDFLSSVEAKEFKTKGNDLQFKCSSKNTLKTNMIKVQQFGTNDFVVKFYTYQPFRHIFDVLKEIKVTEETMLESIKEAMGK